MKKLITATFNNRADAEKAINRLHTDFNISTADISYVYRNEDDTIETGDVEVATSSPAAEGAKEGAVVGGGLGAIVGIATVIGVLPVIGPVFLAGPLIAALGLGGGALGATAAGAVTGAAAGSIVGALSAWGISEQEATEYEKSVGAGNVLVLVHTFEDTNVMDVLRESNATEVNQYVV